MFPPYLYFVTLTEYQQSVKDVDPKEMDALIEDSSFSSREIDL